MWVRIRKYTEQARIFCTRIGLDANIFFRTIWVQKTISPKVEIVQFKFEQVANVIKRVAKEIKKKR
jgi:hypothetical protein